MRKLATRMLVSCCLISSPALAADAVTVVRAGRMLDVESGRTLENVVITIRDAHVVSVVPGGSVAAGAEVVDWSQYTVLPGLMDAHVHLTDNAEDGTWEALGVSVPALTISGVHNAAATLKAGFTTVRNVGTTAYADVALRDATASGKIAGPRILAAGPFIGMRGGHCDSNLLAPEYHHHDEGVADGPWEIRAKVREAVAAGVDLIKFCGSGGVTTKGDQPGTQEYTLEEMQALVEEADKLGRKVASHNHGTQAIKEAIRAGADSIEHASLIDDEGIRMAKQHGTYLVMDIYNDEYIREQGAKSGLLPESLEKEKLVADAQRENFRKAVHAGAKIAFGTDAGLYPHGDNARQFAWMVRYGMTPLQAIRSATLETARLFGIEKESGAIKAGMIADLIAVDGDPLADVARLEKVQAVVHAGALVK